jgi:hypothetical protein
MRFKLALLTTAMAFGLGTTVALAEDAPGAKSDITIVADQPSQGTNDLGTEGKSDVEKPGALSAPNKDDANASGGAMTEPSMPDQSGAAESDAAPGKGAAAQPGSDKGDNM